MLPSSPGHTPSRLLSLAPVRALTRIREEAARPNQAKGVLLSRGSLELLGLTDREADILLGISQGKTNKHIATSLYVSPLTVKTHLQHIYGKVR